MPTQGLIPSLPAEASPSDNRKYPIPALVIFCSTSSADLLTPLAQSNFSLRGVQNGYAVYFNRDRVLLIRRPALHVLRKPGAEAHGFVFVLFQRLPLQPGGVDSYRH